jgi:hypothetical protein
MPREDAAQSEFWEKRFRENFTPWDAGRVPEALEKFLRAEPRGQRVLIPGCGSGYEVRAFAEVRTADAEVGDSIPIFAGKERWQIWTRSTSPSA